MCYYLLKCDLLLKFKSDILKTYETRINLLNKLGWILTWVLPTNLGETSNAFIIGYFFILKKLL